mgnify:CR=1 FL=1
MSKREIGMALAHWQDAPIDLMHQLRATRMMAGGRLQTGQRFHRVGLTSVVWRVLRTYRDGQGVSNRRDHDPKTLSAAVLLDSRQYRLI